MVIWIAIYSAFDTNYFNNEVVALYGEVVFWATVIVTVVLCLGECYDNIIFGPELNVRETIRTSIPHKSNFKFILPS